MIISEEKKNLRRQMKEQRRALTPKERSMRSEEVCKRAMSLPAYNQSENVYCFISLPDELDTTVFIRESLKLGKCVFVPKVIGEQMVFRAIHSESDLEPGCMGISEPKKSCPEPDETQKHGFVLAPGLAFDAKKRRIGYGGGFYDKYFANDRKNYFLAAVGYDFQMVPEIPAEAHDLEMDCIVTEGRTYD